MSCSWRKVRWIVVRLAMCSVVLNVATIIGPAPHKARTGVGEQTVPIDGLAPAMTKTVAVGIGAEMVALSWARTRDDVSFSVRGLDHGAWTEWLSLDGEANDQSTHLPSRGRGAAGPAWLALDVRTFEVRLDRGAPVGVALHALDVKSPNDSGGSALGPAVADAQISPPFIESRVNWGADEGFRNMYPECTTPDYSASVDLAVVHHTVNSNSYAPGDSAALIRGIYYFHTHSNGWCDIGYNFLIDRYGQIFEGRFGGGHKPVIGAHAGGFNAVSTGVALLGTFDTSSLPAVAYASLRNLLAWKLKYHGINPLGTATISVRESDCNCQLWPPGTVVTVPTIVGHRDLDSTGCPGAFVYGFLDQLRHDVAAIVNAPQNADQALACDWNGDGRDTTALYQFGVFFIRQSNTEGAADLQVHYGNDSYVPVCGDWNGDGTDTIGVYDGGWWYLRNSNTPGPPDIVVHYGAPGYVPLVGNWNGVKLLGVKGDGIGVYVSGSWYLRQTPSAGAPDITPFAFGSAWSRPVVGDWAGDGSDGIGIYEGGHWYLRQSPSPGAPQATLLYGRAEDRPVAGDWTIAGADAPGVDRGSWWYLGSLGGTSSYEFPLLPYL
ncbi:MAG: hypothetical protein QOD92_2544 [Acidimicrobiaceae bacterium]|jgi:hypothetical protein